MSKSTNRRNRAIKDLRGNTRRLMQDQPHVPIRPFTRAEAQVFLDEVAPKIKAAYEAINETCPKEAAHGVLILSAAFEETDGTIVAFMAGHPEPLWQALDEACQRDPRVGQLVTTWVMRRIATSDLSQPTNTQDDGKE